MKTLVTGASGFVGSRLIKAFKQEGRSIKCLVRKNLNISDLGANGTEAIRGSLDDPVSLSEATKDVGTVYHLGGEVYSRRTKKYFNTNVLGTENLVKACLRNGVKKFIFLSSLAACGPAMNSNEKLTEDVQEKPLVPYGRSKLEAERKVRKLSEEGSLLPFVIVRSPTLYGPGQGRLINQLILRIKSEQLPFVGGSPEKPIRSLCYIENLVEGLLLAEKNGKFLGETYIIADELPYSQVEIQNTILELVGSDIPRRRRKLAPFIAKGAHTFEKMSNLFGLTFVELYSIFSLLFNFACDISTAKQELGYTPKYDLHTGMEKTIHWMKEMGMIERSQK